jgi:hypothetical protein
MMELSGGRWYATLALSIATITLGLFQLIPGNVSHVRARISTAQHSMLRERHNQ